MNSLFKSFRKQEVDGTIVGAAKYTDEHSLWRVIRCDPKVNDDEFHHQNNQAIRFDDFIKL